MNFEASSDFHSAIDWRCELENLLCKKAVFAFYDELEKLRPRFVPLFGSLLISVMPSV